MWGSRQAATCTCCPTFQPRQGKLELVPPVTHVGDSVAVQLLGALKKQFGSDMRAVAYNPAKNSARRL